MQRFEGIIEDVTFHIPFFQELLFRRICTQVCQPGSYTGLLKEQRSHFSVPWRTENRVWQWRFKYQAFYCWWGKTLTSRIISAGDCRILLCWLVFIFSFIGLKTGTSWLVQQKLGERIALQAASRITVRWCCWVILSDMGLLFVVISCDQISQWNTWWLLSFQIYLMK